MCTINLNSLAAAIRLASILHKDNNDFKITISYKGGKDVCNNQRIKDPTIEKRKSR